jgi:putative ABC transport system permease protein
MTGWLVARTIRHAPRRLVLGAIGIAFPVAMLAATLLFIDSSVHQMTRIALAPVQVEMKALATSLNTDMGALGRRLETVPGVKRAERFAATDAIVTAEGNGTRATARLFAVDPSYLAHHRYPQVVRGALQTGAALLNPALHSQPAFRSATRVSIEIPGAGPPVKLSLRAAGTVDLRDAVTWFTIPTGNVQGDVAMVPRGIVIDYATFEQKLLPALKAKLGTTTPVLDPNLSDLPPVEIESHIAVDHSTYPPDPGRAATWSDRLRRALERQAPGAIVVADNTFEVLSEASVDAGDAKILFLLLGIPGVLVAAALGLAAESALAEAYRREDALMRLRGATDGQLARLVAANAVVAGAVGTVIGLAAAVGAVTAVTGHAPWHEASSGRLAASAAIAAAAGILTTAVRLITVVRAGRRSDLVVERRVLESGWNPLWRRAKLDLVAIGVGAAILAINLAGGGLKQSPQRGPSVALSFYVLLAPIALWIGLTLLAVRGLLAVSERRFRPESGRPLPSWRGAALRWLGRRPARTAVAVVLGALAVAFATEVVSFVGTYQSAKRADTHAAFGSDLRLTPEPSDLPPPPPKLGPHVAAVTPIRYVGVRAGTDRKTVMTIDPATYEPATAVAPRVIEGGGLPELARQPNGVLVAKEVAADYEVHTGDPLPLTLFPDDPEVKRNQTFRVVGVYQSFPPDAPASEMVMTTASFSSFLLPAPEFYLARTVAGHTGAAVAQELQRAGVTHTFAVATTADARRANQRTLATLNLTGLSRIESLGAVLIAAVGVAVLGAFVVLERRREFAILRAIGIDTRRLLVPPAQEGLIAVLASLGLGLVIGVAIAALAVRVLSLFFTLPPPFVSVPGGPLAAFVLLVAGTSALALSVALAAVARIRVASVLREP